MTLNLSMTDLLDYTEWDRGQWEAWFGQQDAKVYAVDLGPNADGRVKNVGELVRHIFSAELRYTERIRGLPLTDTSVMPSDDTQALFDFGRKSRAAMRTLLAELPTDKWNVPQELSLGSIKRSVTPRTMALQAVTHEIRHWAQVATFLRIAGHKTGMHDLLVSGIFDGRAAPGR